MNFTEPKQLEDHACQCQKMEALGRLAGGVAHDFNNLLTVISGHGSILLDELGPAEPARSRVEEILGAAHYAAMLTSQLLAFCRGQFVQPRLLELNHQGYRCGYGRRNQEPSVRALLHHQRKR